MHADPAPRGAYWGCAPQLAACAPLNENCASPKRGLCPEEITSLDVSGAEFEAQISVFCGLTLDFVMFLG